MASLYGRTSKPFEHKEVSTSDTFNAFKSKGKVLKRDFDDFAFDSEDEDTKLTYKQQKIGGDAIEIIDAPASEDNFKAQVQARVKALTQNDNGSYDDDDVVILDDTPGKDTKHSRAAKALMKKIDKAVKGPTPKKGKKAAAEAAAAAAVALNSPQVIELDVPRSSVRLPQRSVVAAHVVDISLDRMQKLAGTSVTRVASSSGAGGRSETEKPQCKLKTRLNGQHERKWRVLFDESFGKLRGKFAAVYGVQVSEVKFHFDGEVVKDSETPQSLDMEDDNMIDVTMDKSLFARAVAAADSALGAAAVPEKPSIRLRTRLNGSHDWKWKVPLDDTFDKLRAKFCEVYGIKPGEVRFEFDGDTVKDKDSPAGLGMEDDNMIDAKVDRMLFAAAVSSANTHQ